VTGVDDRLLLLPAGVQTHRRSTTADLTISELQVYTDHVMTISELQVYTDHAHCMLVYTDHRHCMLVYIDHTHSTQIDTKSLSP